MFETNKLVRDKVVEFMNDRGIAKTSRYVEGKEYQTFLFAKLMEECAEVIGANTKKQITEELADLLEVVDAIRKEFDVSEMDLDETKTIKQCEKGGFYDGCVLEQIDYR